MPGIHVRCQQASESPTITCCLSTSSQNRAFMLFCSWLSSELGKHCAKYSSFTGGKIAEQHLHSKGIPSAYFPCPLFLYLGICLIFVRQDHAAVSMRIYMYLCKEDRKEREIKSWTVFSSNTEFPHGTHCYKIPARTGIHWCSLSWRGYLSGKCAHVWFCVILNPYTLIKKGWWDVSSSFRA